MIRASFAWRGWYFAAMGMNAARLGDLVVWAAVASAVGGCGPSSATAPELLKPKSAGDAFGGLQCSSFRPPTEPDLMAWDSGSRARVDRIKDDGIVAVRYHADGCNVELEVLNCVAKGSYSFKPYRANQSKVMKSQRDLFAELPIGAARLGGKLAGGRALRTDYMLAGVLGVPVTQSFTAADLQGPDCERATHVAGSIYVGGFAMASGESERIAAQASIFGAGAGGEQDRTAEGKEEEGSVAACKKAQDEKKLVDDCSVPLRLGLVPIVGRADAATSSAATANADSSATSGRCPAGMVSIPAGSFMMGADPDKDLGATSSPRHRVQVGAFCMDITEVTVAAYRGCVKNGKCKAPEKEASGDLLGHVCNWGQSDREEHPVNCVDFASASAYCEFSGKRLPSEEEWEYAARGTDDRAYPWGNGPPSNQVCWHRPEGTCAVGSFPAGKSPFGVLDLAGNVSEWTGSKYSPDYNSPPVDWDAHTYRGGSGILGELVHVRAAARDGMPDHATKTLLGFRCAR